MCIFISIILTHAHTQNVGMCLRWAVRCWLGARFTLESCKTLPRTAFGTPRTLHWYTILHVSYDTQNDSRVPQRTYTLYHRRSFGHMLCFIRASLLPKITYALLFWHQDLRYAHFLPVCLALQTPFMLL